MADYNRLEKTCEFNRRQWNSKPRHRERNIRFFQNAEAGLMLAVPERIICVDILEPLDWQRCVGVAE